MGNKPSMEKNSHLNHANNTNNNNKDHNNKKKVSFDENNFSLGSQPIFNQSPIALLSEKHHENPDHFTISRAEYQGSSLTISLYGITRSQAADKEVEFLNQLHHENITKILGNGQWKHFRFIMMPKVIMILETFLKIDDPSDYNSVLSWEMVHSIALQVAKAMKYLHSKNLLFLNLRSKNVFLTEKNESQVSICIYNFKRAQPESDIPAYHREALPSRSWRPPECFQRIKKGILLTKKVDVYSFAMFLVELSTRQKPWAELEPFEIAEALETRRPFLPRGPVDFEEIVKACWDHDPEKRPSFQNIVSKMEKQKPWTQLVQYLSNDLGVEKIFRSEPWLGSAFQGTYHGYKVLIRRINCEDTRQQLEENIFPFTQVDNPGVLPIYGLFEKKDRLYLCEAFPEGVPLATFLRDPPIELHLTALINISAAIILALQWFVQNDIAHQNLSTNSVFIDLKQNQQAHVKVDTGLARFCLKSQSSSSKGMAAWRYAAPEVILFSKKSLAADVWSFGVILWELFTKTEIPFINYQTKEALASDLEKGVTLEQPPDCPDSMWQVMRSCWKIRPKDRPDFQKLLVTLTECYPRSFEEQSKLTQFQESAAADPFQPDDLEFIGE